MVEVEANNKKSKMTIPFIYPYHTVIVANGSFPSHPVPLSFLREASRIVCCDGATEALLKYGFEPDHIVGDLDSLSQKLQQRYSHRLHHDPDQETNDLTKAVNFCTENQWNEITILAATGKREDHSLGNISLLADYAEYANVQMITDYGVFIPLLKSAQFKSFAGQTVSIFSLTPGTVFTFQGLKYPLTGQTISSWWQGTLNEALGAEFFIEMEEGVKALVFRGY
jgi:thiamine pyrophosphokinase